MAPGGVAGGASAPQFGCSLKELRELMEQRGLDAVARIQQQYGGVLELCRRLYTSPTEGIDPSVNGDGDVILDFAPYLCQLIFAAIL